MSKQYLYISYNGHDEPHFSIISKQELESQLEELGKEAEGIKAEYQTVFTSEMPNVRSYNFSWPIGKTIIELKIITPKPYDVVRKWEIE